MMKTGRAIIIIIGLFISYTSVYAAQINFIPELVISAEYTDNLFLDYEEDLKVDDTITTAGIDLNLEVIGQTAGLELSVNPSYQYFTDNDDLNYWRYFANLKAWNNFKRNTRLELNSIYIETEDPRDSSIEANQDIEDTDAVINVDQTRRGRNRYLRSTNDLRLTHQFAANSNVYVSMGYNVLREIDLPESEELDDYDEFLPAMGLEYWIERRWGFLLMSSLSDRAYEDRDDRKEFNGTFRITRSFGRHFSLYLQYRHTSLDFKEENVDEDYQVYAPSAGIEYQIKENTTFRIGAGYYIQDLSESEDDEASFLDAEINQNWNFRTGYVRVTASSGYDIEDTGSEDLGLQIYYEGRLETGYSFSTRFSWDCFLAYRHDEYPNEVPDRSDQTFNAGTGLTYQALRWMNLRLSYEHENVTSDLEAAEFTENSFMLTVTIAPSSPIRLN